MTISFQIEALTAKQFSCYFSMSERDLAAASAYVFCSDQRPCYPCRVSLTDAEVGENVLALSYRHLAVSGPYDAAGPIFVRENAVQARLEVNEVPEMLRHRLLSVRGYSKENLMIDAETIAGQSVERMLTRQFGNQQIEYIQLHNAGPGCFNCTVKRV